MCFVLEPKSQNGTHEIKLKKKDLFVKQNIRKNYCSTEIGSKWLSGLSVVYIPEAQ